MAKRVQDIEGIGPKYAETLNAAGIMTTDSLLEAGASRQGREALSSKCGINEKVILKWVNMSDLFRIKGVASQYAELLEAAGVDTVKELRNRNAANLTEAMAKVNQEKRLVRQVPSEKLVSNWVEQAKVLAPMVTH